MYGTGVFAGFQPQNGKVQSAKSCKLIRFRTVIGVLWNDRYSKFDFLSGTAAPGHRKPTARSAHLGYSSDRTLLDNNCYYGLGMDTMVIVCS